MPQENNHSLRKHVVDSIGAFLFKEGFKPDEITPLGILELINLISDYQEEGVKLFPEIIITNSLDFFKTIPNKELVIAFEELSVNSFVKAMKLCAPLAIDNWIIFIEINEDKIKYGLVSAEMTETSLSIYNQTVGELKIEYDKTTIAFIRNIGQKTVELKGLKSKLVVSLTLDEPSEMTFSEIKDISKNIAVKCEENLRQQIATFFEKIITNALRIGHGNLIAVIDDNDELIENLKEKENNGTFLPNPISFELLIKEAEYNKSNETSINLKSYSSILVSMLNHDGIILFTNTGKLLGYHLLINTYEKEGETLIGGARTKAFASMKNSGFFNSCFYKSQDGNMKIWKSDEQ